MSSLTQTTLLYSLANGANGLNASFENLKIMTNAIAKSIYDATNAMVSSLRELMSAFGKATDVITDIWNEYTNVRNEAKRLFNDKTSPVPTQSNSTGSANIYGSGFKGGIFDELKQSFSGIKNQFQGIFDGLYRGLIKNPTLGASEYLKDKFTPTAQGGTGWKGKVGSVASGIGTAGKAAIAPFATAFSAMGPQFAAMAIVMQPVMEFLNAFLEPFSMISDYFAAFGGILSQALLPIMQAIQPLFDAMLPILQSLVKPLGDLLLAIFNMSNIGLLIQIITPLLPLISSLFTVLSSLLGVVTPIMAAFSQLAGWLVDLLVNALNPVTKAFEWFINLLKDATGSLDEARDSVEHFFSGFKKENIGNTIGGWFK